MKPGPRNIGMFQIYGKVWKMLSRSERRSFVGIIAFTTLGNLLDLSGLLAIFPFLQVIIDPQVINDQAYLGVVYESLEFESTYTFTWFLACGLFTIMLVKNVLMLILSRQQAGFSQKVSIRLSALQFEKVFSLDFESVRSKNSNHLCRDINGIPGKFSVGVLLNLLQLTSEVILVALVVTAILIYEPLLFVVVTLLLGSSFFIVYRTLKNRMTDIGIRQHAMQPVIVKTLQEALLGFLDVTLTRSQAFFGQRYLEQQQAMNETIVRQNVYRWVPHRLTEMLGLLGILLIFGYGYLYAADNREAFMFLGMFAVAAYRITPSINRALQAYITIENDAYSIEALEEHPVPGDCKKTTIGIPPLSFRSQITLEHLEFQYQGSQALLLNGINLTIHKGETLGIIGRSGTGKSTLLKVMAYLLKPSKGEIRVDDVALTPDNASGYYPLLAYVDQDVFLKDGSIIENIAFGIDPDEIDHERMSACITSAGLKEFTDQLPRGLHSEVGEQGMRLSGGQRQRIGIARALYRNAEIFLFDEATASLDTETEEQIKSSIRALAKLGKTVIIAAHRLTTLENCDRTFEVSEGRLEGPLSYKTVMQKHYNYEIN